MARKRVLMLGWEFPPVISGGLGIATLGLCKSLSKLADITLILPRGIPGFSYPNIELIGLDMLEPEKLKELFSVPVPYSYHGSVFKEPAFIHPYMTLNSKADITVNGWQGLDVKPFTLTELYASDVLNKVMEYAAIAVQYAAQKDFDIIHAHDWLTFLPALELKKISGKPLVLHVHSTEYDRTGADNKNWVYALEKLAMTEADAVIPVSGYTGKICEQHYNIPAEKIYPVHNGIDPFFPARKSKTTNKRLVVFFGRITMQKGPEYFVEAAKKVLDKHADVMFVMAGKGDMMQALIERTARLNMGMYFYFTGFLNRTQLAHLLEVADLYCMPSVSEPFGLSALEAAQYGIPIIISKTSGVAEVLSGAIQIDFWDLNKMAEAIISLLDNQELSEKLSAENLVCLQQNSWDASAGKVLKVYEHLI